jgi:hypothetical protein
MSKVLHKRSTRYDTRYSGVCLMCGENDRYHCVLQFRSVLSLADVIACRLLDLAPNENEYRLDSLAGHVE